SERLWQKFVDVLGVADTIGADPRFKRNADRLQHRQELHEALEAIFITQPADHWLDMFRPLGIPCGPINHLDETLNDPHIRARGMVLRMEHPVAGGVQMLANPMHLSDTPVSYRLAPPTLGQHTDETLRELGYDDNAIARLRAAGVI
ncbi:MAG TPA: CoA transferase, partial [Anaerolineae bacterium]|nr:CoA transferase [Anaerolineae bacterium]